MQLAHNNLCSCWVETWKWYKTPIEWRYSAFSFVSSWNWLRYFHSVYCTLCTVHAIKVYSNKYMLIKTCRWKRVMWSTLKQETRSEQIRKRRGKRMWKFRVAVSKQWLQIAISKIRRSYLRARLCFREWPFDVSLMDYTNRFNAYWVLEWLDPNWGSQFMCKLSVFFSRLGIIFISSIEIGFVFFSLYILEIYL